MAPCAGEQFSCVQACESSPSEQMAADPRDQPASDDKWNGGNRDEQRDHRDNKQPVPDHCLPFFIRMTLEKREVPLIGFPPEVEKIAEKWNRADQCVDGGIEDHAELHDLRNAEV